MLREKKEVSDVLVEVCEDIDPRVDLFGYQIWNLGNKIAW